MGSVLLMIRVFLAGKGLLLLVGKARTYCEPFKFHADFTAFKLVCTAQLRAARLFLFPW